MTANESKPIIIDLSESQNADLFKGGDERLLQQTALTRVKEIIKELSEKVRKIKNEPPPMNNMGHAHRHDVITINGERGSGKTTFILNILDLIPKWHDEKVLKCRIKSLGIIDPTLIEDCAHIFLAVISQIKETVENHWEDKRAGSNAETVDMRYQSWRTSLTKLAGGLRNLSTKKDMDGDSWSDPQFIMEEGLGNSAQGAKLEQHFHSFVEESLNFIEAEAFIIALDDVDTKVDTGWPVLEVLRKYLTTPRLIVILSGDIELYTQLISNKQCEQIGIEPKKIIEMPKEYAAAKNLVNDLTEQYMMKIMRPDYRIEMQTVVQITKQKDYRVIVKYGSSGKSDDIEVLLKDFCTEIYGSDFQTTYLAEVLMDVPIRTCIKLLNTATKYLESSKSDESKNRKEEHFEAIVGLGHVFQNSLSTAGLSSKLINEIEAELHMNLGYLAVALKKKNLLKQGFHLFPLQAITSQRQLMMVLGAVYSRALTKQPAMMLFGYLVNMCLPAYLQGVLAKEGTNDEDFFERYLEASQLEMEQEPINSVRRGMKFLIGSRLPTDEYPNEQVSPQNNENIVNKAFCAIEVNLPPVTTWHRLILDMSCVFTEKKNTSQRHLSFYSLLGAIATLAGSIKLPKNEAELFPEDTDDNKRAVLKILRQYGSEDNLGFAKVPDEDQTPQPPTAGSLSEDESESQPRVKDTSQEGDDFGELFARWCWKVPGKKALPLLALTESWNRFLSVTTHLKTKYSEDIGEEGKGPGNFLQDCIVYFLSNLLEYEMVIIGIEGSAPGNHECIESKFANSLESYFRRKKEVGKTCLIFESIFSCPMWMHFINLTDNLGSWEKISTCYVERLRALSPKENLTKENLRKITSCMAGDNEYANLFELMNKNKKKESPGFQE